MVSIGPALDNVLNVCKHPRRRKTEINEKWYEWKPCKNQFFQLQTDEFGALEVPWPIASFDVQMNWCISCLRTTAKLWTVIIPVPPLEGHYWRGHLWRWSSMSQLAALHGTPIPNLGPLKQLRNLMGSQSRYGLETYLSWEMTHQIMRRPATVNQCGLSQPFQSMICIICHSSNMQIRQNCWSATLHHSPKQDAAVPRALLGWAPHHRHIFSNEP